MIRIKVFLLWLIVIFSFGKVQSSDTLTIVGSTYYNAERLQPLKNHLEATLKIPVKTIESSTVRELINTINTKHFDIVLTSAMSYLLMDSGSVSRVDPFLAGTDKNGRFLQYTSAIITNSKNNLESVNQIVSKGKDYRLLFTYPSSTSGHLIPRLKFKELGINAPEKHFKEVNFSQTHEKCIAHVANNTDVIGVCAFPDIEVMEKKGSIPKGSVKVLYTSPPINAGFFLIRKDIPEELRMTVTSALMDEDISKSKDWNDIKGVWGILDINAFKPAHDSLFENLKSGIKDIEGLVYFIMYYEEKLKSQQSEIIKNTQILEDLKSKIKEQGILLDNQKSFLIAAVSAIIIFVALTLIIYRLYGHKRLANSMLHQKNREVVDQHEKLEDLYKTVDHQNRKLTDSLFSARRIQVAMLPQERELGSIVRFSASYAPKDIVSGDFFWTHMSENENKAFICLMDCTGHGVPGAMMSMLGNDWLNEIIRMLNIHDPSAVLEKMDVQIQNSLQNRDYGTFHSMDIALCSFEKLQDGSTKVIYCGALIPMFLFNGKSGKTEKILHTRRSLGGRYRKPPPPFTNQEFILNPEDSLYVTSDGILDQFNEKREKLGTSGFRKFTETIGNKSIEEQETAIDELCNTQLGNSKQLDDISVLVIKPFV